MERGRIHSLKRRIKLADGLKLTELANELISEGKQMPVEVFDALRERISNGAHLDSSTIGKLIVLTRDRE